jgi:1-aminocyclopropane-1-carboxylate deaminase
MPPTLPSTLASLPRIQLTLPTPTAIQPLHNLSRQLSPSGRTAVFVAREDLNSGLAFGGNKTRKLEYVIPHALACGADTLVTEGGLQSNHTRQTAAVAAHLGLKCVLIQSRRVESADPGYAVLGNVQLSRLLGAEVRVVGPEEEEAEAGGVLEGVFRELERSGRKGYYFPVGASGHAYGGVGYARWMVELAETEERMQESGQLGGSGRFDVLFVVCVGGSTLGGMVAGMKLVEKVQKDAGEAVVRRRRRVVGIDASAKDIAAQRQLVLGIARRTAKVIGLEEDDIALEDVVIDGRWNAGRYRHCDHATAAAIRDLAMTEGVITDPVYTGKGIKGTMVAIKAGEVEGNVLFVHTGGQPVLAVYGGIEDT